MSTATPAIEVSVTTRYLRDQSAPEQARYAFSYTITLRNVGNVAARLLTRQWIVRDASGHSEEVRGDGVVGQHPHLQPGESFEYTSGCQVRTSRAMMHGSYFFVGVDAHRFEVNIPLFVLDAHPGRSDHLH